MAENKQKFTYLISADTSEAKKQIADLQKSLDRVQKFNFDNFNIAPDLIKASHAAEELSSHLRAATNVNTGQLDLSKFNQSIRNSNSSLTNLMSDLAQGGSVGQAAFEQMTAAIARTQVPLRQTNALIKDMATSLKNTIKWELSSAAVHGLESALSGAVNYAKNLNTSLTNIRIVTGQTVEDMARFTKEANAAAKSLSTTTKSYADASLIYYQQGDSQEMAAKKAAITIKAANSSFETTAKEMSEYLTAVWNSYQVGADELERYVDIMAALGAKTATSLEEIATSMQKVAATANTVGVSMEQVSSIISTVSSVTRESAESIGTSYKTIFARIGDLKLGETLDDGVDLGSVSSKLQAIGVSILDANGNMREMGDIITDLGNRWQTMNQAQKTAVAQVVAGKRQYTQLMALFENWDMYQNNMNIAQNAEGSLQKMADIYAESWEAASARVRTSFEGIFNSIINDQGLIKLTNFVADFVDGIGSAIDSVGGLNGVLRLTSSILMKTFSKEAGARIKDLGHSVIGAFQDPKKNYQQASNQIKDQLMEINNKKQVDAQIQLIESKNKLLEVEEYLSATQKQAAQVGIADIEAQANKVKELEDAYTELRKSISNVNINKLGAARSSFSDVKETLGEAFTRYSKEINDDLFSSVNLTNDTGLQNVYDALYRSTQMADLGNQSLIAISPENLAQYDNLEQRMSIVRQEAESLRAMMEELGITIDGMPIEKLKGMLDKTDWDKTDIESLREALAELSTDGMQNCSQLQVVLNKFFEEISQAGYSAQDIERLRAAFDRVSNSSDDLASAQRNLAAASENLNQKTDRLNQTLDKQSMSFEKAIETAMDLGSGALDLINGFSAMSDVTAKWGDESLSLADKLGSVLSVVLSLGMAIPSLAKGLALIPGLGGVPAIAIAAIAALGAGAFGVISGQEKAKKTEYQEKQTKDAEKRANEANQRDEELNNIQTLMKNYNTLRETYISTGEGQDALAASARALADAYGLVGANLLIAEGNFTAFEQMISSSTGLDKISAFYEEQLRAGRQEIADIDKKSKYYDQSKLKNAELQFTGKHNWIAPTYSQKQLNALTPNVNDLIGDYHLDTIEAAKVALENSTAEYATLSGLLSQAQNTETRTFISSLDTSKMNMKNDRIDLDENYQETLMNELYEYFDPQIFEQFTGSYGEFGDEAPSYLLSQFESLMQFDENGNAYIMEDKMDEFRNITRKLKEQWLSDFISWGQEQSSLMLEEALKAEPELTKNYEEAIAERQRAQDEAIQGYQEAEIRAAEEEYSKIIGTEQINRNYFDVLSNEEGFLTFNDEGIDRYEWLKTFEQQKQAAQAEYDKIDAALKSGDIEKGSILETLLTKRLENLKSMLEDFNELGDADLSTLIQQMMGYEASAEKVRMITETMSKMIGKSEANTTFTDFNSYMNNIQEGIDASAKEYEQLQTYLQTDESGNFLIGQDGEYLIKEGYEEKYKVARDKIAAGFISDFTSFDDYLAIYQNIAAVFSGTDFTSAMSYIDAQKIKNSREVDTKLLHAMQRDLSNGLEIGATANSVLTFNRQTLAGEKAVEDYQTISSLASSYKENLNLTDAQGLLSVLQQELDDGTNAWNDFIQMDFDQRQAYLQAREESALRAAQSAQRQIAEDALTEQEKLYSSSTAFKAAKQESDEFFNTYIRQENGTYVNKNNDSEIIPAEVGIEKEALRDKVADYEQLGLTAENATALANAIELILTQTSGLSTQMQTLVADFEKFNKTGKVSAEVMKKMVEWGIDGSKIKTAQDYLKIMKSISIEAKNNADAKKAEYDDMANGEIYDWSNKETQEQNAKLYTKWKEWQDLLQIQYDTEEQYNAAYQNYLDLELAKGQQILSQMRERKSLAEEEASKTQQLAESMTAAIQSGNLNEAARAGMDSELLAAWDNAANATERGAIAAQAWNKYAAQMASAGEDLAVLYDNAEKSLDGYINTLRYKTNDIVNFNFSDTYKGKDDFAKFISQQVKDPKVQAIWNEGFDSLISHTDISNMSDLNILIAVRDEVIKAGDMTAEEFDKILAGIKDNISSTFEQLAQNNIDAAQKAADAWLNAFNTIKSARQTLLSGGSILEQIAGNPKLIYQLMQSTNLPAEDIYEMVLTNNRQGLLEKTQSYLDSEDKKTSYLEYLLGSYGLSDNFGRNTYFSGDIESLGYRQDEQGRWVGPNGQSLSDKTNISEYNKEAVQAIQQHLIAQYSQVLKNIDETLDENTAKDLATKIVSGDKEAYSQLTDSAKKFAEALGFSVDALYEFTKQQELATDVAYKGNASNLTKEQIEAKGALINGQVGTYDEYQKLATAIANAQEAKYNGESWDSLAQADRDLLDKYNINFDNVDTAATDCAKALAACANAAYQLALDAAEDKGYSYDPKTGVYTKDGNKVTEQDDPIVKALEASRLGAESATANISDVSYNTYEQMAKSVGMTVDEFKTLKKAIENADTSLSLAEEDINKITLATAKAEKALQELKDSFNDNIKIIKKADQNSSTYISTMAKMRKQLSDIFDTDEKYITDDFVKNNLKNMEKMAKGTKKEAKAAAEAISDNLVEQIFELEKIKDTEIKVQTDTGPAEMEISSFFTDFMDKYDSLEIGTHINTGPAIDALNSILSSGQMTADQITAALNAIGWEPQIQYDEYPVDSTMPVSGGIMIPIPNADGKGVHMQFFPSSGVIQEAGVVKVPRIGEKGITKIGSGGSTPKRSPSGGSGGGSKKKETKEYKRYQDEIERYHKNNETLSRVSEQLDKIEKQKERVYGAKYIDRIDEETEALKRQLEAQQALYDEANKYIAADKVDVARYGAIFDQDGTIVNYEEVMRNIIDEYNRAIDVYNASDQEEGAKKALEAAEERYNDAVKSIENYEEAIQKANEAENNMLETRNKLSAAEVEKITYKLEFKLEMNERDLALLEYYQDKYAEQLDKQDDIFASYFDAAAEYEQNLNAIGEAYNSLVSKYAAGLITEKDYAEQLEELHDKALDNLKSLNEVEENLIDSYTQALELAQEQVGKTTSSIESANETLQSYMDILNLYEGATDYKKMANFYDMMNKNNITNIEVQKKHLDVLLAEEDKFQEKIRNGQELTELEKKEYEALEEQIQDTRATLLSTTQEALETIRSTYENTINGIADDLDNFMAGSAGSLSYLQEQYEQFQEEQEQYVSTTKELYEVSKLNRDIEGSIADATSKASKEALKALQEKINKQSELNQLTEYDLQMNQLEYQLLLARINLEETKNAKDVVRLTRDDNGNYAYRYTANQDKIDEAAQKYEDVLQQINELTVQRISDTEQKLVNAMANYKEKFVEIATDYTLTEEERLMKLEELTNNFSKNMQYIQEQNQIATDNLATNQEMIADYYGASMSEITSSTAGNVNDNIQSMMNKTQEYVEYMNNAIYGKEGWQTAWKEYIAGLSNIKESSGQAYEDMMNNAQEMGEMNDFSAEQAENVLNVLEDTLEPLTNLTEAWNAHNAILNNTIETYENLAQVIQGTLAAIGQIPNTVGAGDAKTTIDGKAYAKGGLVDYTGLAWVDGTPDDPELMLNAGDTQNILAAASVANSLDKGILRTLMESVSTTAQAMLGMLSNAYHAIGINPVSSTTLDQQVHITAEFPNVTDHNEIEEALSTLVNRAAQFANHK